MANQFLPGGGRFARVEISKFRPGMQDAVPIHQEVAVRGLRGGARRGVHPAAGLGALAPAILAFFRFK